LISNFDSDETEFHNRLIKLRDKEYAHSDAFPLDIHIYESGDFTHSWRVVRQNIDIKELKLLLKMIEKIKKQINICFNDLGLVNKNGETQI